MRHLRVCVTSEGISCSPGTGVVRCPTPSFSKMVPLSQLFQLLPLRRMSAAPPVASQDAVPEASCLASAASDASLFPLKIGGLFLILVASLIGALLPLFSRNNGLPTLYLLARAFAGNRRPSIPACTPASPRGSVFMEHAGA